jgi:hypothetical protein
MTVRNWLTPIREKILYVTPDGKTFDFHDPLHRVSVAMKGWGMPDPKIATTFGPYQHGENVLSIQMPVRDVSLMFRYNGCSREEYLLHRYQLANFLRLNRTNMNNPSPGFLRWYRADGSIRQLDVYLVSGPKYDPPTTGWDHFAIHEELKFTAFNPIIYTPTEKNQTFLGFQCSILNTLQFPFSFDSTEIIFGGSSCNSQTDISVDYVGNWMEFPKILVTGPAENFSITHQEMGWTLELENYTIAAGETVTFDLTYGKKTITNNLGVSLLGYLSSDSEIGLFSIQPDPIVADGVNDFVVSVDNGTTDTTVLFNYFDRYIAI